MTLTYNNVTLSVFAKMTFRLKANGGQGDGLVSNSVTTEGMNFMTMYNGWSLDQSFTIGGVMTPYVGSGLEFLATVYDISGDDNVLLEEGFNYQWYRLNPYTYEMTLIENAVGQEVYITTNVDIGYKIVAKAVGDGLLAGGFVAAIGYNTIKVQLKAEAVEKSANGLILEFDHLIDVDDIDLLIIYNTEDYSEIEVTKITKVDNNGTYRFEMDLTNVEEISINLEGGSFVLVEEMDKGEMVMQGMTIVLIEK